MERQARLSDQETLSKTMSPNLGKDELARLPCCALPVARNGRFFGRRDILDDIDERLQGHGDSQGLKSLAIHGLGGIGKTQIALEYAYSKQSQYDAILWVPAKDDLAMQQGFTKIAVDGLKLPNANSQSHQENVLSVVAWLQQTGESIVLMALLNTEPYSCEMASDL